MLTSGLLLVVGLAVLLAGRRLFWVFVAATGFMVGLRVGAVLLAGAAEWVVVAVAIALGLLGALLAVFFQWVAIALAGFVAGAQAALVAAELMGVTSDGWAWAAAVAGGVLAAALLLWLWDAILVVLSALVGAALLVQLTTLGPSGEALAFAGLFLAGVLVQMSLFGPARRGPAPGGRRPLGTRP